MAGRILGEAFVVISPDTTGFRAKTDAQVKAALSGLKYTVPVGVDTEGTVTAIRTLQQRIRLMGLADFLDINIPVGRVITQIQLLRRLLSQGKVADILEVNLDRASLAEAEAKIGALSATIPLKFAITDLPEASRILAAEKIPVGFDVSHLPSMNLMPETIRAAWNLEPLKPLADAMARGVKETIPVSFDVSEIPVRGPALPMMPVADMERAAAEVSVLSTSLGSINWKTADTALNALGNGLVSVQAQAAKTASILTALSAADTLLAGQNQRLSANYRSLAAAQGLVALAAKALNVQTSPLWSAWVRGTGIIGGLGGAFAIATGKIALFSGMFGKIPLLGSISVWHLAVETILEFAATLIPATVALAAWGAVAAPTFADVYKRAQSLYTAQQALGQQINVVFTNAVTGQKKITNLGAAFQQMTNAVKPQVYTLLGEALYVVSSKAGTLNPIVTAAGKVIDDLGARFAYAVTTGNAFNVFIKNAAGDLAGWGNLIGNIGGIIGGILKQLPGYGEIFLTVLQNVTHAVEMFVNSGFGQALLGVGLAAHGAAIWIGLLSTAFTLLATRALAGLSTMFLNLGVALDKIGFSVAAGAVASLGSKLGILAATAGPIIGVFTLVAAAIGFAIYQARTAKSVVQEFFASLQQQASQAALTNLTATLSTQLLQAQKDVSTSTAAVAAAQSNLASVLKGTKTTWVDNAAAILKAQQQLALAKSVQSDYVAGLAGIQQEQQTVNQHVQQAAAIFGGTAAAWALLNAAGITSAQLLDTNKQHWAEALIEAQAYQQVLQAATQGSGRFQAAQNDLNFAADDTANTLGLLDADLQKVTQSETAMMNVITGGRTAFDTFQQGIYTLSGDLNTATGAASGTAASLFNTTISAGAAGAAMQGLSQNSLNLNAAFYSSVQNAQNLINALQMQDIGTSDLTSAVATMANQMLAFAGSNTEARAVVIDLINNALGPGTVSMQNLDKWVGQNSISLAGFSGIVARSTINASHLANVLQDQLNVMLAQASVDAVGGQKALDQFAAGVVGGNNAAQLLYQNGGANVLKMFQQMYGSRGAPAVQAAFIDWAHNGLNLSQNAAQDLYDKLVVLADFQNGTLTGAVLSSKAKFEQWAGPGGGSGLGLARSQADDLWSSLRTLQGQIDSMHGTTIPITGELSGVGTVIVQPTGNAAGVVGAGGIRFVGAEGGLVDIGSGPTADDVLARLSKGETVVSARDSKKLAPLFRAMKIPGYASGGVAGYPVLSGDLRGVNPDLSSIAGKDLARISQADLQKLVSHDIAAIKLAQAKAAASASTTGGGGAVNFAIIPTGGALIRPSPATAEEWAHAKLASGIYGWGLGNWPSLLNLWMGESGWRWNATNPASGAYGIPQSLPASKMAAAGADWLTDAATQMSWGMAYIRASYGSPITAYSDWLSRSPHWYKLGGKVMDQGGWLMPGWNPPMINNTGRPEPVGMPSCMTIQLEITGSTGSGTFDAFLNTWLRNNVRVKGGGNVQRAWGRPH